VTRERLAAFRRTILRWYRDHGRDLPWRHTRDPYSILVSEVMLQQTQVDRVVAKYAAFLNRFPTLRALALARLGDVLRTWSGLGYNRRARRLWECARKVTNEAQGTFPADVTALRALPGIGRYTASAVACFAFHTRAAVVDTNIRRVLSRALDGVDDAGERRAWDLAQFSLPPRAAHDWSQALMDVGALFCRPRPKCESCPAASFCKARRSRSIAQVPARVRPRAGAFKNSRRYYRGRVIAVLTGVPSLSFLSLGEQVKAGFQKTDLPWLLTLLAQLRRDGLVEMDRRRRLARLP
jgi:A/G-specific adenine glycosylase